MARPASGLRPVLTAGTACSVPRGVPGAGERAAGKQGGHLGPRKGRAGERPKKGPPGRKLPWAWHCEGSIGIAGLWCVRTWASALCGGGLSWTFGVPLFQPSSQAVASVPLPAQLCSCRKPLRLCFPWPSLFPSGHTCLDSAQSWD